MINSIADTNMIQTRVRQFTRVMLVISIFPTTYVAALEQPEFELVDEIGELQIRRYQPVIVARTLVGGSFDEVGNQGFKRLAGYIFGGNESDQKIAMTAPVGLTPEGDADERYWITFSMPSEHSVEELPTPNDARVEITEESERFVAVVRYKGNWSEKRYREHESRLLALVEQSRSWIRNGEVTWARYNPPFVPGFMRTNEVAVEVFPFGRGRE